MIDFIEQYRKSSLFIKVGCFVERHSDVSVCVRDDNNCVCYVSKNNMYKFQSKRGNQFTNDTV